MRKWLALIIAIISVFSCSSAENELVMKPLGQGIMLIEGENRMVEDAGTVCSPEKMKKMVNGLNAVFDSLGEEKPPIYLYLVESSRSHQIDMEFDEDSPAYIYLKENLHADVFDHLKYSTYEQFCDYFYTTDHHWNYKGSYQGYQDIVRMLLGQEEEILVPADVFVCKQIFNGLHSKERFRKGQLHQQGDLLR